MSMIIYGYCSFDIYIDELELFLCIKSIRNQKVETQVKLNRVASLRIVVFSFCLLRFDFF